MGRKKKQFDTVPAGCIFLAAVFLFFKLVGMFSVYSKYIQSFLVL